MSDALKEKHLGVRKSFPIPPGPILGLVAVLGTFLVLLGYRGELGRFLSVDNLQVLVHENTIIAMVALGSLIVIISGGIDLSVGSVAALVTVVMMQIYRVTYSHSHSTLLASVLAVPAGIGVGGVCGLTNGAIITALRVPPFVTTLGMMSIARGLAIWISERNILSFPYGARPAWVNSLAQTASRFVFSPGFWVLLLLAAITAAFLRFSVLGRYCYAIGSNQATARLCGVPIGRTKMLLYTLAGLLTGCAGVLSFAHSGSGEPSGNSGLELEVIAAVVIGGASLTGGQGTVSGTLLGVLILGILSNGVSAFKVPLEVKHILIGGFIIANTAVSQWQRRRRG